MKDIGLYIHIPFCKQKCIYCAFLSFCDKQKYVLDYFKKLREELLCHKNRLKGKRLSTIYIGGGTPSVVDANLIRDLLEFIKKNFVIKTDAEISIESNPDSITKEKALIWRDCGINRVSVGLQSVDDDMLKLLNRPHTFSQYLMAIQVLKDAGFENINSDILIGLFGQSKDELKETIQTLSRLNLTHISAYGLMVEENTPLNKLVIEKKIVLPAEDEAVKLYNTAYAELKKYGYNRYEISNFCKKNFECKHNLNYWNRGEFLGVGLGSYSFLNGEHFENTTSLEDYLNLPYKRKNIEKETQKTKVEETIMLALRLEKGLDLKKFNRDFNIDFEQKYQSQIKKLLESNLIKIENGFLKIVDFEISNYIISQFF